MHGDFRGLMMPKAVSLSDSYRSDRCCFFGPSSGLNDGANSHFPVFVECLLVEIPKSSAVLMKKDSSDSKVDRF